MLSALIFYAPRKATREFPGRRATRHGGLCHPAPLREPARDHKPQLACIRAGVAPGASSTSRRTRWRRRSSLMPRASAHHESDSRVSRPPTQARASLVSETSLIRSLKACCSTLAARILGAAGCSSCPPRGHVVDATLRILPETFSTALVSGGLSRSEAFAVLMVA